MNFDELPLVSGQDWLVTILNPAVARDMAISTGRAVAAMERAARVLEAEQTKPRVYPRNTVCDKCGQTYWIGSYCVSCRHALDLAERRENQRREALRLEGVAGSFRALHPMELRVELSQQIERARLNKRQRLVIRQIVLRGRSVEDVAHQLGRSQGRIRENLKSALWLCRKVMER